VIDDVTPIDGGAIDGVCVIVGCCQLMLTP
jgi:hypothetical protein